jgi:hypothetical protein
MKGQLGATTAPRSTILRNFFRVASSEPAARAPGEREPFPDQGQVVRAGGFVDSDAINEVKENVLYVSVRRIKPVADASSSTVASSPTVTHHNIVWEVAIASQSSQSIFTARVYLLFLGI